MNFATLKHSLDVGQLNRLGQYDVCAMTNVDCIAANSSYLNGFFSTGRSELPVSRLPAAMPARFNGHRGNISYLSTGVRFNPNRLPADWGPMWTPIKRQTPRRSLANGRRQKWPWATQRSLSVHDKV